MHLDPHKTSLRATRLSWYRTCTGATPPFLLRTQWAEPTTSKSCELWCTPNRSHPISSRTAYSHALVEEAGTKSFKWLTRDQVCSCTKQSRTQEPMAQLETKQEQATAHLDNYPKMLVQIAHKSLHRATYDHLQGTCHLSTPSAI